MLRWRRWSRERYEGAVGALVHILRCMAATQPDACVLRPALREEARKAIGAISLAALLSCARLPSARLPRPCCIGQTMRIRHTSCSFLQLA